MTLADRSVSSLAPHELARVERLLDEALDLGAEARLAWQGALAEREPELAPVVLALLAAMQTDTPAQTVDLVARRMGAVAAESGAGRRIGPYRLELLLGRGGMGTVWRAQREDGLLGRPVAVKLMHAHLAGPGALQRFHRERQILGTLDHPAIVRLLDAGITPDGQPWLAMDAVQGRPLTEHCDRQRLDLAARVRLVLQVLAAVQHAHQALVVHRDLKPANILVDDGGAVHLLDFGIAKLVADGGDETEITQLAGRALTPEYASPEQLAGRPVGTASDVYALGVLLYALLCGRRPYAVPRTSRAAYEEAVLQAEPLKPSEQRADETIAAARATTPRRLAQALAGDLDTIVLKALKKDPAERYATADALRDDLQRWLDGRPVQARPDRAGYRLRKFVARHRWRVAGGAALALLLVAATGVSLWQAGRARAERENALAAQQFLQQIFTANTVNQADPQRARATTARELLDIGAARIARDLSGAPQVQQELLSTLADMYWQLGLQDEAARLRRQRVDVLRTLHGERDVRVAQAWIEYAHEVAEGDQRAQAVPALDEARRILDAIGDHRSPARGWLWLQSAQLNQYLSIGDARADAERALAHFRAHPDGWSGFHALQATARAHYMAGDYAQALALHREALALAEDRAGADSAWTLTPMVQIAEAEAALGNAAAAEAGLRRALAASLRLSGPADAGTLQTQAKLGGLLHQQGRRDEGLALLRDAESRLAAPGTPPAPNAQSALDRALGSALLADGDAAGAERHFANELADLRANYPDSVPLARTLLLHARAQVALGRLDAAEREIAEAKALWQRHGGSAVRPLTWARYRVDEAHLRIAQGRRAEAQALLAPVLAGVGPAPVVDEARALAATGSR